MPRVRMPRVTCQGSHANGRMPRVTCQGSHAKGLESVVGTCSVRAARGARAKLADGLEQRHVVRAHEVLRHVCNVRICNVDVNVPY